MDLAPLGLQQAGLVRIGEKRHGIVGFDQHDVPKTLQRRLRRFDHVRHPIDRKPPAAARHPRTGQRAHHPAAGLAGDLRRQRQSLLRHRAAGHQQQGLFAAAQHLGRVLDGLRGVALTLRFHRHLGHAVGFVPRGVGRQDQGCDLRRRAARRGNGGSAVTGDRFGVRRSPNPGRHRPRQALDVGGQRRIVFDVVGGMLADDVDDAGIGLLGVVQIGKAVGEPGAEMQQRRGRRALHAEIAVGGPGHHALEQAEHAAHALDPVQCGDEMHLRGAGIGEADVDAARDQCPHQTFRTVHGLAPVRDCSQDGSRSIIVHPFRQRFSRQCSHRLRCVAFFNRRVRKWRAHGLFACEIAAVMACLAAYSDFSRGRK